MLTPQMQLVPKTQPPTKPPQQPPPKPKPLSEPPSKEEPRSKSPSPEVKEEAKREQAPSSATSHRVTSDPKYDVVALLERGKTMSKVQARFAFATYLTRVQQRLMAETSGGEEEDSEAANEQMVWKLLFTFSETHRLWHCTGPLKLQYWET